MKLLSNTFTVNNDTVAKTVLKLSWTITDTDWVANTGDYPYKQALTISQIKATDYVMVDILPDYEDVALSAGISKYCLEYDGGVYVYAKNTTTEEIDIMITILRG